MKIPVINPFLVMAVAFPTFITLAVLNNKDAAMGVGSVIMAYLLYALSREINHDGKPFRIGRRVPVVPPPKREPIMAPEKAQPGQCFICGVVDPEHLKVFGSPQHASCLAWLGDYRPVPHVESQPEYPATLGDLKIKTREVERKFKAIEGRFVSQTQELQALRDAHTLVVQQNRLLRANLESYYSRPPSYYGETTPVHSITCSCGACVAVRRAYREGPDLFEFQEMQPFLKPAKPEEDSE